MKYVLILAGILLTFPKLYAQPNTFPAEGNVGIGTTSPGSKLDVNGGITSNNTSNINGLTFSLYNTYYRQLQAPGYNLHILSGDGLSKLSLPFSSSAPAHFQNYGLLVDNNVGIGVIDPSAKLTVAQSSSLSNPLTASFGRGLTLNNFQRGVGYNAPVLITGVSNENNDGYSGLLMLGSSYLTESANQYLGGIEFVQPTTGKSQGNASSKAAIYGVATGAGGNIAGYGGMLQFTTRPDNSNSNPWESVRMVIDQDGAVGIGTTTPTEKLSVNGKIRAKEIKVEAAPWPDYVFKPEYKLKTLPQIEQFIKENRHLPEIPSAAEVEKDGISLGEMNGLLLKKIEELTLYLIELQKDNALIKEDNKSQQKEINQLKSKL